MTQLTNADLAGMTPEQITAAHIEGRCNDVLGVSPEQTAAQVKALDPKAVLDGDDVDELARHGFHEAIDRARTEGRITYPNGETP